MKVWMGAAGLVLLLVTATTSAAVINPISQSPLRRGYGHGGRLGFVVPSPSSSPALGLRSGGRSSGISTSHMPILAPPVDTSGWTTPSATSIAHERAWLRQGAHWASRRPSVLAAAGQGVTGLRRSTNGGIAGSLSMTATADTSKMGFKGVGPAEGGWGAEVGMQEEERLPEDQSLVRGVLPNGLRYCIKRNKMPAGRFLVNLEVHTGSVDEQDDEQGIAHFLEHMLFLGTESFPDPDAMRTVLGKLGMSQLADANAYTDFRSTVYTLSAPTRGEDYSRRYDMEASSAAANRDTMFRSGLVSAPVTITTILPKEYEEEDDDEEEDDQEDDDSEDYGDDDEKDARAAAEGGAGGDACNVGLVIDLLHQMTFKALIRQESVDSERGAILNEYRDCKDLSDRVASKYYRQMFSETALPKRFPIGKEELIKSFSSKDIRHFYDKHYFPANMHIFVVGDLDEAEALKQIERTFGAEQAGPREGTGEQPAGLADTPLEGKMSEWPVRGAHISHRFGEMVGAPFESVTHSQITDFSLTLTVKEALESNDRTRHLREGMLDTLSGMALAFRTEEVVRSCDDPPFTRVDWNYFNSAREGCVLNSVTVSGEARLWREAVTMGVREVKRLMLHGITDGELQLLKRTLIGQYRQDAEQEETTGSGEWLEEIMDSAETGSSFISATQAFDLATALLPTISLDAVNARVRQLYGFVADGEPHHLFVTAPKELSGEGSITEGEVRACLRAADEETAAYAFGDEVPDFLTNRDTAGVAGGSWVAVSSNVEGTSAKGMRMEGGTKLVDESIGIVLRRMSNGLRFAHKRTEFDKGQAHVHISVPGGRALEGACGEGGEKRGATVVGLQALTESGLGAYDASLIAKFCALHELDYTASCEGERATFDLTFSTAHEGCVRRAMEVVSLFLGATTVDPKALKRTQRAHRTDYESNARNLEGACGNALWRAVTTTPKGTPDPRFEPLDPDSCSAVTPEEATQAVRRQMGAAELEVIVVGDFDAEELEREALMCLGGLASGDALVPGKGEGVWDLTFRGKGEVKVRVADDVERTSVMMMVQSVNRWGEGRGVVWSDVYPGGAGEFESKMAKHGQMFANRCLILAQDVVNNRLYERIREQKGLVYSIGMSWDPLFYMSAGFISISLMPFPDKINEVSLAVKAVIRELLDNGFSEAEFSAVQTPVVKEIRESLDSNAYWVSLLEGLQSDGRQPKTLDSIRDIPDMYNSLTRDDCLAVLRGALKDFEDKMVVLQGVSGPDVEGVEVEIL